MQNHPKKNKRHRCRLLDAKSLRKKIFWEEQHLLTSRHRGAMLALLSGAEALRPLLHRETEA